MEHDRVRRCHAIPAIENAPGTSAFLDIWSSFGGVVDAPALTSAMVIIE
jgi:hypothetical protein